MTIAELVDFKERARTTWAAGDYAHIARRDLWGVGAWIVERLRVAAGDEVLDVACGTGNVAIRAAQAGARVVALDLAPELLEAGRELAREAGVDVEWVEGDAEALPFGDETFDVVVSTFGCMFAPRHEVAAAELARVLRRGGRLGVCSWTPEGAIGEFFATVGRHLPPPPDFAAPPPLWGSEAHVEQLFSGKGLDLEFERRVVELRFESVPDAVDYYATKFGPIVKARQVLEPQGRWDALRDDLSELFERVTTRQDGELVERGEYLAVLGRKR